MNRMWRVTIDLLDADGRRRDASHTMTGAAWTAPRQPWLDGFRHDRRGDESAAHRISEELANARTLADQLARRLERAATRSRARRQAPEGL
ncbi:hypothetical protein ACIG47_05295 [Promicromonospora sp. NPDC052451]|uniref:hypothetical protein n=1 Tax=Promicromonospora sp. NPDC052451 TaxID=3364407 RepID=UPI0037CAAA81